MLGYQMELKKAPVLWHLTEVRMNQHRSGFSSDSVIKLGLNFTHFFYAITPQFLGFLRRFWLRLAAL